MKKEIKALRKLAEKQGWQVTFARNGHMCWRSPEGRTVHSPASPSDVRAMKNTTARLRQRGLVV